VLFAVGLGLAEDGGLVPRPAASRIIYVDQCCVCEDGGGLFPDRPLATIQAAIDLARHGDRVFVYPGTYTESLDLKGKAITIKGIAGPLGLPMLVASQQSAVQMLSGEDSRTVLQNLVIHQSLIGISLVDSNPTLQNLTVVKCGIGVLGLGRSDPKINSCILWDNSLEDLAGVTAFYSCIEKRNELSRLYNMSVDPLFLDSQNNDYRLRTSHGRYESTLDQWVYDEVTSPCISTGDPAMDFGSEPQPNGDRVNTGAFGNTIFARTGPDPSVLVHISGYSGGHDSAGGHVTVPARVESLDRKIVRVEFYMDGMFVAMDDDPQKGWAAEWSFEYVKNSEFEVIAVAVDVYGVRSLSNTFIPFRR